MIAEGAQLKLVGFGVRAGTVVVGTSGVRAALGRGELALVIVAGDRSNRTEDKVVRLARARGVPLVAAPSASQLGKSIGRGPVQTIGVKDRHLARGIAGRMTVASQEA